MYSVRYSCQILMELEFSRQIFSKILKYQFSWNSVLCESSCFMRTDGQIDRRTDMAKLIVTFLSFATRLKISFTFKDKVVLVSCWEKDHF